jgi:S1-C subfamily serine protease
MALSLLRPLAEQGNAEAQYQIGFNYWLSNDEVDAAEWFRLAAERGHPKAQNHLGIMYLGGTGVPESYDEAYRWVAQGAFQGDADAQTNLGYLYRDGTGVPVNYVEAYKWWILSAAQGDVVAARLKNSLKEEMTPAQINEAQGLAAAWTPERRGLPPHQKEPVSPAEPIEGSGTGFYVTAAGHLVTNAHVVEECRQVTLANGVMLTIVDVDRDADLALLGSTGAASSMPLALRQGRGIRLAENIIVAGYPLAGLLSSGLNVTTGTVSALAGLGDDGRQIQITAPVQPGNSGGPLLDQSGNVVGVVVSKLDAVALASVIGDIPQNVNFAVSLGTLQAFLDANSIDYQTRPSTAQKTNADVAEVARESTVQIKCIG